MSRQDPKALYDGFSVITKGVNSGLAPVSLGRDELAWAINTTFRNNYATCRPGIVRRVLNFSAVSGGSSFTSQVFAGAIAFERRKQLVTMIGGHLYSIGLDSWNVLDVSTPNDFNPSNRYRAWFAEAEDFIIAQDGQSAPWLYDGATSRRSDTFGMFGAQEVPVGTAMCYGNGRLNVASPDGREFVIGDIVGGDSGTQAYNFRDSVIKFTENQVVAEGGAFSVPINCGPIVAFRPVAQLDTSTGQGPMQALTVSAIFSINTPTDRTTWELVTFPIQTVSLVQSGGLSDRSTVNVNGDIWTRSFDGIRSYIVARREFSYNWVNAPMSQEMIRAIENDDPFLLGYCSAAIFDNRLLITVQPYRNWGHGICHRGLAVLDFAPLAYLADRAGPAWEGVWTGLQVLQILTGNFNGHERCFIFALNSANQIELWELTKSSSFDYNGTNDVPIAWSVETGAWTFPRFQGTETVPGQELIALDGGRLFVDEIEGSVNFAASYRLDQDPCWHDWWSWSACASNETCGTTGSYESCITPLTLEQQYRKPFFLPSPREATDTVTHKNLNWGREAQGRLQITGKCRIKRLESLGRDQQDDVVSIPSAAEQCVAVTCDECRNDYSYSITENTIPTTPGLPPPSPPGTPATPIVRPVVVPPGGPPPEPPTPLPAPSPVPTPLPPPVIVTRPPPTLPGVPPYILLPTNPPTAQYGCFPFFHGIWTDPGPPDVNGNDHELGRSVVPPLGLTGTVYHDWATQLWQKFSDFVVANHLTVSKAQILLVYDGGGADRRYDAEQALATNFYTSAFWLGYVLVIDYCV